MEITDEKLETFFKNLREINNSTENMVTTLADMIIALRQQLIRVEHLLAEVSTIAQQPAADPS